MLWCRERLLRYPYAPLVQEYMKCTDAKWKAVYDQAGIAIGTMQLLLPIAVMVIIAVVVIIKNAMGVDDDEKYTKVSEAMVSMVVG